MKPARSLLDQWGLWAFARYCHKHGVGFETCYWLVFGRMPRLVEPGQIVWKPQHADPGLWT